MNRTISYFDCVDAMFIKIQVNFTILYCKIQKIVTVFTPDSI